MVFGVLKECDVSNYKHRNIVERVVETTSLFIFTFSKFSEDYVPEFFNVLENVGNKLRL